ncbi:hypothetical protein Fcan01_22750 [Folsomia candida]|uniref:Uncharacterized protein n=1 Tax=Folsomia candida TaxID=158441 RepID=A0A226DAH2_FOLCA|nr:hypothetical protein Fcan01_22750 [Folsomia candida]
MPTTSPDRQTSPHSSPKKIDLDLIYKTMLKQFKDVKDTQSHIMKRLDNMEAEKEKLVENQIAMQESLTSFQNEVKSDFQKFEEKYDEEIRKIRKLNNLVVMGIPETNDGQKLLTDLLKIIYPTSYTSLKLDERIGQLTTSSLRPVRLRFSSATERQLALDNCKNLKGLVQFDKISVKKDLTRKQQELKQNSRTPVQTRSRSSHKQPADDHASGIQFPTQKQRRTRNSDPGSHMDTQ